MFGKKRVREQEKTTQKQSAKDKDAFSDAQGWEVSIIGEAEKSKIFAQRMAASFGVIAALSVTALCLLTPLKEVVPYVIRVDSSTGIPDIVTTIKNKSVPKDEVMDKYFLAKYIQHRYSYDWNTIQLDYDTTLLLSAQQPAAEYLKEFEGENARDKRYGKRQRVLTNIISVVPDPEKGIATIRFTETVQSIDSTDKKGETKQWIATVSYEYSGANGMSEKDRLINPFGFHVLSMRRDPELVQVAPAPVVPAPAPAAEAQQEVAQ